MTGKVIQGLFIGGRPRIPAPVAQTSMMPRQARPPAPALARCAPIVQPHSSGDVFQVDPAQLGLASGGGRRLPDAVRGKMEAALGADFSGVRVHVGPQAERVGAIALTMGTDIYFAPGRYQPDTVQGQQLLGHELAHVMQQRLGRVRNPLGGGIAVVQDRALEAEADRLGHRAAAQRVAVQPKLAPGAAQPPSPVRISPPISAGPSRYRLTAGAAGRKIGSVMVHAHDKASLEVTDLRVDPAHREHGIGKLLLDSAARTGQRFGKSKVMLAAQDSGSGRLTHWYKEMGFAQVGVNQYGYPQLEAPISRMLAGAAQPSRARWSPQKFQPSCAQLAGAFHPIIPPRARSFQSLYRSIQMMEEPEKARDKYKIYPQDNIVKIPVDLLVGTHLAVSESFDDGKKVQATADELVANPQLVNNPKFTLTVFKATRPGDPDGPAYCWSANNRRLKAMKLAHKLLKEEGKSLPEVNIKWATESDLMDATLPHKWNNIDAIGDVPFANFATRIARYESGDTPEKKVTTPKQTQKLHVELKKQREKEKPTKFTGPRGQRTQAERKKEDELFSKLTADQLADIYDL